MGLDVGGNEGTVWDSVDLENELSATESVVESMISFLSNQVRPLPLIVVASADERL